jgi:hypothetical protein
MKATTKKHRAKFADLKEVIASLDGAIHDLAVVECAAHTPDSYELLPGFLFRVGERIKATRGRLAALAGKS